MRPSAGMKWTPVAVAMAVVWFRSAYSPPPTKVKVFLSSFLFLLDVFSSILSWIHFFVEISRIAKSIAEIQREDIEEEERRFWRSKFYLLHKKIKFQIQFL